MSVTTLYGTVTSHIGGPWVLHLVDDKPNGSLTIREINSFLGELTLEEVDSFWAQYPNLEDRENITRVVVINTDDFSKAATTEGTYSFGEECLHRIHRLAFNKEYEEE